jgi:PKD repeat protein
VVNLPATLTVLQPAEILGVTYTITNLQVEFNANAVGTLPLTFDWDFGDGDTSALEDPTHVYPEGGPYTPTLTVSNMCGIDTWTGSFTLCDPAAGADFTWMPADPMLGETIYFTASLVSGDPPYSFAWDWGDGTTDSGRYAQHTYAEGGEYLVNLTVTNACGVATASHTVTVMGPEILVSPVAITVTVPAGQTGSGFVTISNTGSSDLHITDIDGLQPWLSIPFTQTVIAAGASTELTFTFNAAGLPAASYQSTVMIHSDSPTQPVVEVIVTMMISEYVLYLPLVMKAP